MLRLLQRPSADSNTRLSSSSGGSSNNNRNNNMRTTTTAAATAAAGDPTNVSTTSSVASFVVINDNNNNNRQQYYEQWQRRIEQSVKATGCSYVNRINLIQNLIPVLVPSTIDDINNNNNIYNSIQLQLHVIRYEPRTSTAKLFDTNTMRWINYNNNNTTTIPFPSICEERRNEMNVYSRCVKNRCFVLHGTIPYHYKDNIYHQLINIYLPHPNFPQVPPVLYVRKAAMEATTTLDDASSTAVAYIEKFASNHPSVDPTSGQIYCQYLTNWNSTTSTLHSLLETVSDSFRNQPPVVRSRQQHQQSYVAMNHTNNNGALTGTEITFVLPQPPPSNASIATTETVSSTTALTLQNNEDFSLYDEDFEDVTELRTTTDNDLNNTNNYVNDTMGNVRNDNNTTIQQQSVLPIETASLSSTARQQNTQIQQESNSVTTGSLQYGNNNTGLSEKETNEANENNMFELQNSTTLRISNGRIQPPQQPNPQPQVGTHCPTNSLSELFVLPAPNMLDGIESTQQQQQQQNIEEAVLINTETTTTTDWTTPESSRQVRPTIPNLPSPPPSVSSPQRRPPTAPPAVVVTVRPGLETPDSIRSVRSTVTVSSLVPPPSQLPFRIMGVNTTAALRARSNSGTSVENLITQTGPPNNLRVESPQRLRQPTIQHEGDESRNRDSSTSQHSLQMPRTDSFGSSISGSIQSRTLLPHNIDVPPRSDNRNSLRSTSASTASLITAPLLHLPSIQPGVDISKMVNLKLQFTCSTQYTIIQSIYDRCTQGLRQSEQTIIKQLTLYRNEKERLQQQCKIVRTRYYQMQQRMAALLSMDGSLTSIVQQRQRDRALTLPEETLMSTSTTTPTVFGIHNRRRSVDHIITIRRTNVPSSAASLGDELPLSVSSSLYETDIVQSDFDQVMIELQAEDNALRDASFELDYALRVGKITCDTYLRYTRTIAIQQFYARAKLLKLIKLQQERFAEL